jgi:cytochrome c oxidase subunit 2
VKNEDLPAEYRTIQVTAAQFAWSFSYPDLDIGPVGELHLPIGDTVKLELRANDVIHSFFVPEWRLKQDTVPGTLQRIIVTPTKLGRFPVICTELCGIGHSTMRSWVVVESREDFDRWVQELQQGAGPADGKEIFAQAGCSSCHALADAGSTAEVGPNLDNVLPGQSEDAVRQSIVDPNAQISEGYQPDVMPQNFGETLSDEQLDALVAYLLQVAGT